MELSYYLGQLIGLSSMVFAVVAILNPRLITKAVEEVEEASLLRLMVGVFGIVAGIALILSHNVWEASWRVIITFYGWAALLKGATYIAMPQVLVGLAEDIYRNEARIKMVLILLFILGAYLTYKSFGN